MNYNVEEGLLKEGSLSAKIYFLLLIPKTKSEVSRIIYNGKIQLSNISKNIDDSLHIRYDVTAKRMGFIQQGEGFFKKEIDTNPGSLWEMLDKECAG